MLQIFKLFKRRHVPRGTTMAKLKHFKQFQHGRPDLRVRWPARENIIKKRKRGEQKEKQRKNKKKRKHKKQ